MERTTVQKAIWYGVAAGVVYFSIRGVVDYRAEKKIYDSAKKAYDVALNKVDPQAAAKWDYRCMAKGIDAQHYRVNQVRKQVIWSLNERQPPWETHKFTYSPMGFEEFWETELSTKAKEALGKAAGKIGLSLDQAREQIKGYNKIPKFENPYPSLPRAPDASNQAMIYGLLSGGLVVVGGVALHPVGLETLGFLGVIAVFVTRG